MSSLISNLSNNTSKLKSHYFSLLYSYCRRKGKQKGTANILIPVFEKEKTVTKSVIVNDYCEFLLAISQKQLAPYVQKIVLFKSSTHIHMYTNMRFDSLQDYRGLFPRV